MPAAVLHFVKFCFFLNNLALYITNVLQLLLGSAPRPVAADDCDDALVRQTGASLTSEWRLFIDMYLN